MSWVPRVHLTPAQLAIVGLVLGAAISGAAQALHGGTGAIDWNAVVAAAFTSGFAAWTQSHAHSDPGDTHTAPIGLSAPPLDVPPAPPRIANSPPPPPPPAA